jgi:hypothetical protein
LAKTPMLPVMGPSQTLKPLIFNAFCLPKL